MKSLPGRRSLLVLCQSIPPRSESIVLASRCHPLVHARGYDEGSSQNITVLLKIKHEGPIRKGRLDTTPVWHLFPHTTSSRFVKPRKLLDWHQWSRKKQEGKERREKGRPFDASQNTVGPRTASEMRHARKGATASQPCSFRGSRRSITRISSPRPSSKIVFIPFCLTDYTFVPAKFDVDPCGPQPEHTGQQDRGQGM